MPAFGGMRALIGWALIGVGADTDEFRRDVQRAVLRAEKTQKANIGVGVDKKQVDLSREVFKDLREILTGAAAAFVAFKTAAFAIKWPAIQAGGILAAQGVSQLTAALAAVAGAAQSAAGVLAILPGLYASIGQTAGAFAFAFGGIGAALKAHGKETAGAGRAAGDLAKAQQQSARRIELAHRRVRDAQEARTRAVEDATDRERRAQEEVEEAVRDLARAYEDAAERQENAAERVAASERRLADAQRNARRAQEDLTRAREEEREAMEALRREYDALLLDEERQIIAVERAQEAREATFEDEGSSEREKREADLRYREEVARLEEIRRRREENRKELERSNREGVEGSRRVQDAREREADAIREIRDAERELAEARRDQVREQEDSAERIREAQERVREANEGVGLAAIESARALRDANENVADSLYELSEAMRDAGDAGRSGGGGMNAFADAMKDLSPEARRFVEFLISLKPLMKELRDEASKNMFPGLERGIKDALVLFPIFKDAIGATAKVIGDWAEKAGQMMKQDVWKRDFGIILGANTEFIRLMGDALLNVADILRIVMAAASPLLIWVGEGIEKWTRYAKAALEAGRESGKLGEFFKETKETLSLLMGILGNIGRTLGNVFLAGTDTGQSFLAKLKKITGEWAAWTGSMEGQHALKKWFENSKPLITELGKLVGDLLKGIFGLADEKGKGNLVDVVRFLRLEILPILIEFFQGAKEGFTDKLLSLLKNVAEIFKNLAGQSGPLGGLVGALERITGWLAKLSAIPGLASIVATISALGLAIKLLNIGPIVHLVTHLLLMKGAAGGAAAVVGGKGAGGLLGSVLGAGGGIKGLLGKVIGFAKYLTGPWGRAIAIGTAAVSAWVQHTESGAKAWGWLKDQVKAGVKDLKGDFNEAKKFFTENVDTTKAKALELGGPVTDEIIRAYQKSEAAITSSWIKHGKISGDTVAIVTTNANKIRDAAVQAANEEAEKRVKTLTFLRDKTGELSADEYNKRVANVYKQRDDSIAAAEAQRAGVLQKIEELRAAGVNVTQQMVDEMLNINRGQATEAVNIAEENKKKRTDILTLLRNEHGKISAETASQVIKESIKTRDETIRAAEDQYRKIISETNRARERGDIDAETANRIIAKAKETRDSTVQSAKDGHRDVVAEVKGMGKDSVDSVNTETGKIKTGWQSLRDSLISSAKSMADGVAGWFSDLWKRIKAINWPKMPWQQSSPIPLVVDAEKMRKGVARQFGKLEKDLQGRNWPKIATEGTGGKVGMRVDEYGGRQAAADGQWNVDVNVTSMRPDHVAGPIANELGWLMARRAYGRR